MTFLGELLDALPVVRALQKVRFVPFEVEVRGVGVFPDVSRPAVVWVGARSAALIDLTRDVQNVLEKFRKEEHQTIVPHLTVARVSGLVRIEKVLEKWKDYSFGRFTVSTFVLYESVLTAEGPVYGVVKEFSMGC